MTDLNSDKSMLPRLKSRQHEALLQGLFDHMPSHVYIFAVKSDGLAAQDYAVLEMNPAALKQHALSREKAIDRTLADLRPGQADDALLQCLHQTHQTGCEQSLYLQSELKGRLFHSECRIFRLSAGEVVVICSDISSLKAAEMKHRESERRYRSLVENMNEVFYQLDPDGNIVYLSPNVKDMSGYEPSELLKKSALAFVHPEDLADGLDSFSEVIDGAVERTVYRFLKKDGGLVWLSTKAKQVYADGKLSGLQGVLTDVTSLKESQEKAKFLSYHDQLTGLYNRRFMEQILDELDTLQNLPLCIMNLDINGLRLTNDAFGERRGDELIQAVAKILRQVCGHKAIMGRIGGDEFLLLLTHTDAEQALKIRRQIFALAAKTSVGPSIVSLAIGYEIKTSPDTDIEAVKQAAESHMYRNKQKHGKAMRSRTIETVIRSINNKYDKEQIHTERVAQYCEILARAMDFAEPEIEKIKTAGILHDIGKIAIPADLLNKSEPLSEEEFALIRQHPETSYNLLLAVDEYNDLALSVLHHHERWDGNGYPQGLALEGIPIVSRIIAVADAYEAMTANRSYQKTKSKKEALTEIERCAGSQFDPRIARLFIHIMKQDNEVLTP